MAAHVCLCVNVNEMSSTYRPDALSNPNGI